MFQLSHLSYKYSANIGWRGSGCEDQNLDRLRLFHRRWWSAKIAVKLWLSSQKQSALQCAQLVGYVKLFSSNGRNSTADYVDSSTLFVSRPNVCGRVRNNETSGEIHISVAVFWKGHIFHLGIVWWEAAGLKKKKNTFGKSLMWTGKTVQLSNRTKSFKFLTTFFQLMSSGEKFPSDRGQRKYSELVANHVFRLGFLIYPFKDIIISYVTGLLKVLSVYLISASPGKMICVNVNRAMNTSRPHYKYAGWLSHQELNNSSEVLKRGKKAGERLGRDIFQPCLQQLTESFWLHIRTFFSNFSGDKTGYFDKMLGHFQSYLCWQNQEF